MTIDTIHARNVRIRELTARAERAEVWDVRKLLFEVGVSSFRGEHITVLPEDELEFLREWLRDVLTRANR